MTNFLWANIILLTSILFSCTESKQKKLPYIGFHEVINGDTAYHKIPEFSFFNQKGVVINNDSLSNYIYVSDFFYSYCPTICPKVKSQILRIYNRYENENNLKFVSFALDPKRDNVENLKFYSDNLGVDSDRWYFLTGNRAEIWDLAEKYLISVREDAEEPGGIFHSGKIILIDQNGHIRGFSEGTNEDKVTAFMNEIDLLLYEIESK